MASRKECDKPEHVEAQCLWVQDAVAAKERRLVDRLVETKAADSATRRPLNLRVDKPLIVFGLQLVAPCEGVELDV